MECAAKPWHPGVPLEGTSSVQDVLKTISFVRGSPGYANIGAKLAARNCTSVEYLAEYSSVEFCAHSAAKGCEIKRKARVYQAAIEAAIQRRLPADNALKSEFGGTVKKETGGDMSARSAKIAPSEGFNPTKYTRMWPARRATTSERSRRSSIWTSSGSTSRRTRSRLSATTCRAA